MQNRRATVSACHATAATVSESENIPDRLVVEPGGYLDGRLSVPGDKSISHRAVMFSALADGRSEITGCLMGEDVRATMAAFQALGAEVAIEPSKVIVTGRGIDGLSAPSLPLDLGNSGTSMRLLTGILAGAGIAATLSGDASLSRRPMGRVVDPLREMGAVLETADGGRPPLTICRRTHTARDRLSNAGRQRPGQISAFARGFVRNRRDHRDRARGHP